MLTFQWDVCVPTGTISQDGKAVSEHSSLGVHFCLCYWELRLRAAWGIPKMWPQGVSRWALPWAPARSAPAVQTELLNVAGSSFCLGNCPLDDDSPPFPKSWGRNSVGERFRKLLHAGCLNCLCVTVGEKQKRSLCIKLHPKASCGRGTDVGRKQSKWSHPAVGEKHQYYIVQNKANSTSNTKLKGKHLPLSDLLPCIYSNNK